MTLEQQKTIKDDSNTHELIYVNKRAYIKSGDVYYSTKKVLTVNKDKSHTFTFSWDDEKPLKLEQINK
jgi:hypothetical protein